MSFLLNKFSPILKVHSWGGFGSQLFGALVIMKLQERSPGRRIKIVIHTSGVTRRVTEFNFESLGIHLQQVEDYQASTGKSFKEGHPLRITSRLISKVKKVLGSVLFQLHILERVNNDESLDSVKPWTIGIRGHYTNLVMEKHLVHSLYNKIFDPYVNAHNVSINFAIHYRLGDLLHLTEKSPIQPERVETLIEELSLDSTSRVLFSDSTPEELCNYFKDFKGLSEFKCFNVNTVATLHACINAETFIGTNAKLSLWAALFRYCIYNKESYLPLELSWASDFGLKSNWY